MKPSSACSLLFLSLSPCLSAGEVMVDFDAVSVPSGSGQIPIANPWVENGMKLECRRPNNNSLSDLQVLGPATGRFVGGIAASAKWSYSRFDYLREDGGVFAMKSIRLHPFSNGVNGTVTFNGFKSGGGTVSVTYNTGTSLNGIVHNFPASFSDLTKLSWTVNNNQSGFAYHQFDELTVEVPPVVSIPPSVTLSEGHGEYALRVRLDEPLATSVSLGFTVAGTASRGPDFTSSMGATGSLFIPAGTTSLAPTLFLPSDADNEGPETILITWNSLSSDYLLPATETVVTIGDMNGSGFPDYVSGHGLTRDDADPDADPNGDGFTNLESYVHRFNPAGPSAGGWRERLPSFVTNSLRSGVYPGLTYQVPSPLPQDVRFTIRYGTDLVDGTVIGSRTGYGVGSLWSGGSQIEETGSRSRVVTAWSPVAIKAGTRSGAKQFLKVDYVYSPGVIGVE